MVWREKSCMWSCGHIVDGALLLFSGRVERPRSVVGGFGHRRVGGVFGGGRRAVRVRAAAGMGAGTVGETVVQDLVLVGGGHTHVAVLKGFGMRPVKGVRLTLVARDVHTPYSGMLPGLIAGHYTYDETHVDLRRLCRFANARLVHASAVALDRGERNLYVAERDEGPRPGVPGGARPRRPPIKYDWLSLDVGSTPQQSSVEGSGEGATPVKPIDGFNARWEKMLGEIVEEAGLRLKEAQGEWRAPHQVVVVGGGAGGVELLLAMQYRVKVELEARFGVGDTLERHAKFVLVTRGKLLNAFSQGVRDAFGKILGERGVEVVENTSVSRVVPPPRSGEYGVLECADPDRQVRFNSCLWCTQAGAQAWMGQSGLAVDADGFVRVGATLQSVNDPRVFAAGDCAASDPYPRPKAGVFAVRQGPPLTENLRRALAGKATLPFVPQSTFLSILSTGDKYAVATKAGFHLSGAYLWRWKDRIDRTWMEKYSDLPEMETPAARKRKADAIRADPVISNAGPEALAAVLTRDMRCGGCGAKVGQSALERVMQELELGGKQRSGDVILGIGDDAAVVRVPEGHLAVHTVDFFRAHVDDPYRFGMIAANHALGDCYAMGAAPQSALAIAVVPFGPEEKVAGELGQVLAGAVRVLNEAGCALVGGHSAEGAELMLGFSVNGIVRQDRILTKGRGMSAGDAVVVTKGLGTGALMAADMRKLAKGRWATACIESMCQSQQRASEILRDVGHATGCTDITGFGLVGHLTEMVRANNRRLQDLDDGKAPLVEASVSLDALPALAGACEVLALGAQSSLQNENTKAIHAVRTSAGGDLRAHPKFKLLFDPQTAGGMLATVPAPYLDECMKQLHASGYTEACAVGRVAHVPEGTDPDLTPAVALTP